MIRSILSMVVALGLMASGDACSWLCQVGSLPDAETVEMASHCGGGEPASPEPEPSSHDDCPGCEVDTAVQSASPESLASGLAVGLAMEPLWSGPDIVASANRVLPAPPDRSPPRAVLQITSSLRL